MAVFTNVSDTQAKEFLENYNVGALVWLMPITQGTDNTNYFIETETGRFVLTIFEERIKQEDLPFIFAFMAHLKKNGVQCPAILENKTGRAAGKKAVLAPCLQGKTLEQHSVPQIEAAAKNLASMHKASEWFSEILPNRMSFDAWEKILAALGNLPDKIEAGLAEYLQGKIKFLKSQWPDNLPRGAIHADYFPDNLFFEGDNVSGIIDFYFSCTDYYLYDLALAYNAFCFKDGQYMPEEAGHFMEAYQSVRALSQDELKYCGLVAQGAAFRILVTRLYHYLIPRGQSHGTPKDPKEYLKILRFHEQS